MATNKLITLVTGGNAGIGYHVVQQLSLTNKHHVLLGSRSLSKAQNAISQMQSPEQDPSNPSNIEPIEIDVTDDNSIAAAAKFVQEKYGRLDILMNNAGISKHPSQTSDLGPNGDGTDPRLREQYLAQYNTNVFGPAIVIDTFLPLLRHSTLPGGKRISFTGSSTGSLSLSSDPRFPALAGRLYRIYRSTKSALNMLVVSYADELGEEGFVVSAACPGHCGTALNNFKGAKHPRDGAKAVIHAAVAPASEVNGRLVTEEKPVPW